MNRRSLSAMLACILAATMTTMLGCNLKLPKIKAPKVDKFDLSDIAPIELPPRPAGQKVMAYATEYMVDLGVADGEPGQDAEVRVVLPNPMPKGKVPALVVNGSGAYLFSGMVLSDEDIEPLLPYVEKGFAIIAYETDGCQPSFDREPNASDIAQMTRQYVASKAGLVNAERAIDFALKRFPEIDSGQLYSIGHSSGGKQALLLAAHDDRIKGCVGFAPACHMDMPSRMTVKRISGGDSATLLAEVSRSMPLAHAKSTKVPMLLLYSSSDQVTRPTEVINYARAIGKKYAIAMPVKCSGHGSVPSTGFKYALKWLKGQVKRNARRNGDELQETEDLIASGPAVEEAVADEDAAADGDAVADEDAVADGDAVADEDAVADVSEVDEDVDQDAPVEARQTLTSAETELPKPKLPAKFQPSAAQPLYPGVKRNPFIKD